MAKQRKMMEYGYEPMEFDEKGTLLVLDSFEEFSQADLAKVLAVAEAKKFTKVVLFPHNEKTLRTMGATDVPPFHKRVKHLESLIDDISTPIAIQIDPWEEKRKKYTPIELLLRYFEESYQAPFFLYVTDGYANVFATFASFGECIKKVRLLIDPVHGIKAHPQLEKHSNRWDYV